MFYEVIPTDAFRTANGSGVLTYHFDQELLPGHLVLIPIGPRTVVGIVARRVAKVAFPTKPIARLLTPIPLPRHLLQSLLWLSDYYLSPLSSVASCALPSGLASRNAFQNNKNTPISPRKPPKSPQAASKTTTAVPPQKTSKTAKTTLSASQGANCLKIPLIDLNSAQRNALKALQEAPGTTRLLQGVTGSGKTNIYLQLAADTLRRQKSVILLVPEIALTSQLVQIFEQTFGQRIVLMHSGQTLVERRNTWLKLLQTTPDTAARIRTSGEAIATFDKAVPQDNEPQIIIGPRSALFAPVGNLGLIIIDEAHESAYYQENTPHYSALRLASFIASTLKIPCIAGTATPNIVDYHLAKTHHSLVRLTQKAKSTAIAPQIDIVDLKDRSKFYKNRYFSDQLLTTIEKTLQAHHQTLIFHNRRGSAPLTICEECGWQALCPECYLPMILHADGYILNCHICGHQAKVPSSCPNCGHPGIVHKGFGTKLLESELARFFPHAKIARFDGDNTKKNDLASLYQDVKSGKINILIGTQTLARGLDLPLLSTVGIVQADAGLTLPDFTAEERNFELLTQVIGRVGRGHLDTANVVVQTYQPDHPVLNSALRSDFETFANYILKQRRSGHLPPFSYLARLSITYKTEKTTLAKIRAAHAELSQNPALKLSPPMPAFHERTARGFTWQITLKSTSRATLRQALLPYTKFQIELDPPSLL